MPITQLKTNVFQVDYIKHRKAQGIKEQQQIFVKVILDQYLVKRTQDADWNIAQSLMGTKEANALKIHLLKHMSSLSSLKVQAPNSICPPHEDISQNGRREIPLLEKSDPTFKKLEAAIPLLQNLLHKFDLSKNIHLRHRITEIDKDERFTPEGLGNIGPMTIEGFNKSVDFLLNFLLKTDPNLLLTSFSAIGIDEFSQFIELLTSNLNSQEQKDLLDAKIEDFENRLYEYIEDHGISTTGDIFNLMRDALTSEIIGFNVNGTGDEVPQRNPIIVPQKAAMIPRNNYAEMLIFSKVFILGACKVFKEITNPTQNRL